MYMLSGKDLPVMTGYQIVKELNIVGEISEIKYKVIQSNEILSQTASKFGNT